MEQRDITRIKQVTSRLMRAMLEEKQLEENLKKKVAERHELEFDIIPTLMHELAIKDITLNGDIELKVGPYYRASIPADAKIKQQAFDWLRKHNFGGLIKRDITTHLVVGEDKLAAEVIKALDKLKVPYDDKQAVHHMTLTAFVREQVEKGNAKLPLDILGAFVGEKATIKLPKGE